MSNVKGKCDSEKYRWSKGQNKCVLKKSEAKKKGESGFKYVHNPEKVYKRGEFRKGKTKEEWIRSGGRRQNTLINAYKAGVIGASARTLMKSIFNKR